MVKTTKATIRPSTRKTRTVKSLAKPSTKRGARSEAQAQKVDYYPNRVAFYTAVSAVFILLLLAVIVSV